MLYSLLYYPLKILIIDKMIKQSFFFLAYLIWDCILLNLLNGVFFITYSIGYGIGFGINSFLNIRCVKNFLFDIGDISHELLCILEKGLNFAFSSSRVSVSEDIVLTKSFESLKHYPDYFFSNAVTISAFGLLSQHFYQNYFEIFKLHDALNNKKIAMGLSKSNIHSPFNLALYGSVAFLQVAASVATALSVITPNSKVSKSTALLISGAAEIAMQIYKNSVQTSISELSTLENNGKNKVNKLETDLRTTMDELEKVQTDYKCCIATNKSLSKELNRKLHEGSQNALYQAFYNKVIVISDDYKNSLQKVINEFNLCLDKLSEDHSKSVLGIPQRGLLQIDI